MRISNVLRFATVTLMAAACLHVGALSAKDIALAQKVIAQAIKMSEKYDDVDLVAPEPLADANGKYVSPYTRDGEVTEWAEKSVTAEAGSMAGEMAGEKAADSLAKKIPFGGLMRGKAKDTASAAGAATALGGWDSIREASDMSFDDMSDMAVYLHVSHGDEPGYDQNLAAAMSLYPELKKGYNKAIKKAYKDAKRAQKSR